MSATLRVRVFKADGSKLEEYEVTPERWLLFGREDGASWISELVDSSSGHLMLREFPDLLDRRCNHVVLPDEAVARTAGEEPSYLTSSRSVVLVHGDAGWWLINPSDRTTVDVRSWGKQRAQLRPRGDRRLVQERRLAFWVPSNLGGPHRVEVEIVSPFVSAGYGSGRGTTSLSHSLTTANKRALCFFFEDFLRWSPPKRDPKVGVYGHERVRALQAAGRPAPYGSALRDIFKSVAERNGQDLWLLPVSAEASAHLWTLENAVDNGDLEYDDVLAVFKEFDDAEIAWKQLVAEQVSRYEHGLAKDLEGTGWWRAASPRARGKVLDRVGTLLTFALEKRHVVKASPDAFLTSLSGMKVAELHSTLATDGRVTLPVDDVLDASELELVGDLVLRVA